MAGEAKAITMPFQEAIDYLQQKDPRVSSHWTEYLNEAHARSFVVAGAAKQALVDDFKAAIDKAISQGTGFAEFRGDFHDIVKKHGWKHFGNSGWRAKIIYNTNMANAYAAGRYAQATDPDVLKAFPYWEYLHVNCAHPRPQHVAWSGLVLRADDPWWDTHYPPNGWNCHCIVASLNDRELTRRGMTGPDKAPPMDWREYVNRTTGVVSKYPAGVDPGFAYNPGKAWMEGKPAVVTTPDVKAVTPEVIPLPSVPREKPLPALDAELTEAMRPWAEKLSDRESDALWNYKDNGGRQMNKVLLGTLDNAAMALSAKVLEAALDRAVMPRTVRVWRAASPEEMQMFLSHGVGGVFPSKTFVSTTVNKPSAEDFQKRYKKRGIVQIIVLKGTRGAAYVHPFPQEQHKQYEVLLNVGTKLRIVREGPELVIVAGDEDSVDGK